MISIAELIRYLPKQHGEHGVDATLHMLTQKQHILNEVFSNTPGGSWTQFDIVRPATNEIYRWDHMPRVPEAKRPDWVLQFNEEKVMNFLLTESKQHFDDYYADMGKLLIQFFTQSRGYLGIRNRPAWHKQKSAESELEFIPPEEDESVRFWLKNYTNGIKYWTGFAFALNPEHYEKTSDLDLEAVTDQMKDLLSRRGDIEVVLGIGWAGKYHNPFVIRSYSKVFKATKFASTLDKLLSPALLE